MSPDAKEIIRRLSRQGQRLGALIRSLEHLESDVRSIHGGRRKVHFCIDFRELWRYLSLRPLEPTGREEERWEEYVIALLFHYLPQPLILLPEFYREFRASLEALAFTRSNLENERRLWLTDLRQRLELQVSGPNGLLEALEGLGRGGGESAGTMDELRGRVLVILEDISKGLSDTQKAISFAQRFDDLYRNQKISGLKSLFPDFDSDALKRTSVYWRARTLFESMRPRRDKVNETDASALDFVYNLNRFYAKRKESFILISSVDTMRRAVAVINDNDLINRGERIEVRDLSYWSLWFSLIMREGGEEIPTLGQIDLLQESFLPILRQLEKQCGKLLAALESSFSVENKISESLEEANRYLSSLGESLGRIYEPILGGRTLFAELASAFLPVAHEKEFRDSIEKIRMLLEKIRVPGQDLASIRAELASVVGGLAEVLSRVENEAVDKLGMQLDRWADNLIVEWGFSGESFDESYEPLLHALDELGRSAVEQILQRREELLPLGALKFEDKLLMARISLLKGDTDGASAWLEKMPVEERARPSVQLTLASVREQLGLLDEAEEILRRLIKVYRDPSPRLRLAALLARRERAYPSPKLDEAVQLSFLAYQEAIGRSLMLETEAAVLYYKLNSLDLERQSDIPWLTSARLDLVELGKKWSKLQDVNKLKEALQSLEGQIEGLIIKGKELPNIP